MADFHKLLVLVLLSLVTDVLGQTTVLTTAETVVTENITEFKTDGNTTEAPGVTEFKTEATTTVLPKTVVVTDSSTTVTGPVEETTGLSTEGITLFCGNDFLEVHIPTERLTDGAQGKDLIFNNSHCTGVKEDGEDFIVLSTNLTDCKTKRTQDDTHEVYSNVVVNNESGTISRQYKVEIPVECSYNRSGRVSQAWYQLTDYVLDKDLEETGTYSFDLKFYEDNTFGKTIEGYPYVVGLDEELYFAASLGSEEYNDLDLSIKSCKATYENNYDADPNYPLITEWKVVEEETDKTDISCFSETDDTNTESIRVTTHAFRFIEFKGDQNEVYIHCDLFVCAVSGDDARCKDQCANNPDPARRRRDISLNSPPLPIQRLTRGPIRFRRAAPVFNAPDQMEIQHGDNSGVQVSTPLTMWALIVVVMGSVVIVLLAALVVTLRKLVTTKKTTTAQKDDEAHVGLINDNDTD